VFKSHGSADAFAFERALNRAYDASGNNLLGKVQERIAHAAPLLAHVAAVNLPDVAVALTPGVPSAVSQAPVH
jgi:glycerol-3-phosphate acyltransferase PlsX